MIQLMIVSVEVDNKAITERDSESFREPRAIAAPHILTQRLPHFPRNLD